MSFEEYLEHYTDVSKMLMFLALALAFSVICVFYILMIVGVQARFVPRSERKQFYYEKAHNTIQRFYEMVFSGASILSFLALYYLIDRFSPETGDFREFWDNYKDFLLLLMICLSIVFNNILDRMLIPLKKVTSSDRAGVRVLGMLYVILIFLYIKFIYENDNYDGFIMYFLGLMIGRFIYFDASFRDGIKTVLGALRNFPILILGLGFTAFMAYTGFTSDYLLVSNGVLVSTFIAHIYMIVAIFIIHHSHFMGLFARKPKPHEAGMVYENIDEPSVYYEEYDDGYDEGYDGYDGYDEYGDNDDHDDYGSDYYYDE
ncbi:MAG: hypothetical protein K6E49_06640 [Lachnospiraceae bacterium]|nr:hypothetical protein [Lachnospiraceae bacterium]